MIDVIARVVPDMDEAAYHAHPALSQSGAKLILKSPSIYRHAMSQPVESDALDLGKAAHTLVLGVGAEIVVIEADTWQTKAAREAKAEARAEGKAPLLTKQFEQVRAMADKLSEHALAMRLLSAGEPEVSLFATDEATGVELRGRIDWLHPTVATDYKTTVVEDPYSFGKTCAAYGYHQQSAWYLDLLEACGLPQRTFAFIVQSKTAPYDVFVTDLDYASVERGRELNRRAIERFRDCTATGLWPAAVRDDAFLTSSIPRWAYYDNEIEEQTL